METIVFATGNDSKLKELVKLAPANMQITSQKVDLNEIQSLDVREIVEHKLQEAYRQIGKPVIVEDVGAGLASLNGLPGPFMKFFEQQLGRDALYQIQKVSNDEVTIRCIAGFYDGQRMLFGEGIVHGHITAARGENGFGFDSVVVPDNQPDGQQRTFAEMTTEEKNAISHRGQALRNLLAQLQ
jgi:non-canonical purine NTP pyrophosphatase (RdgB/HAM1 family)